MTAKEAREKFIARRMEQYVDLPQEDQDEIRAGLEKSPSPAMGNLHPDAITDPE